jgi:hypothetical protein
MIEIIYITLAVLFISISAISEAVMDKLQFHWSKTIFAINPDKYKPLFWNPKLSWENKYKDAETLEPKFLGSTTLFVFTTDAWHLFKFFKNTSIFLALFFILLIFKSFLFSAIFTISVRILYGGAFVLFYNKLLEFKDVYGIAGKVSSAGNEIKSDWMDNVNKKK